MGKRKLHGHGFYVCDYTGLTIPSAMAFMPQWPTDTDTGVIEAGAKPTRRGAYLCWEAVLAHARETTDAAMLKHIEAYISMVTKTDASKLVSAPSFKTLTHFGGTHTAQSYFKIYRISLFSLKWSIYLLWSCLLVMVLRYCLQGQASSSTQSLTFLTR